ncbi:MAG: hypothetical protein H3C48_08540 [Chitinophagaceae bacterium]|nr:hypothetical protein [Chitinophagaceae bacterium]
MKILSCSFFWFFVLSVFVAGCNNKTTEASTENPGLSGQLEAIEYHSSMPATTTSFELSLI